MSVAYGKGSKGLATKLHSTLVRSVKHCESCPYVCPCIDKYKHTKECKLTCAHIEGRKASATRTLLINGFSLCYSCHRKFTDSPLSFSRFVTGTWAAEYRDTLMWLARTPTKVNWTDRLAELKEYKKRLEAGESLSTLRQEEAENL